MRDWARSWCLGGDSVGCESSSDMTEFLEFINRIELTACI